jgi:regulator of sigma E protease
MTQIQDAGGGGLFGLGLFNEPSVVGEVVVGRPAAGAGLQTGDRIVGINGEPVMFWVQMTRLIQASEGRPLAVEWVRPGAAAGAADERFQAGITPQREEDGRYVIGIGLPERRETYSFGQAVVAGVADTWLNTRAIVINLKRIFTGREDLRKNLGGPVMVAKITGQAAQAGAEAFWSIVALLSITLAIVNILPIPALDGGHLVFLLYEGITRREPSLKVRMVTQQVGMVLLLTLMAFLVFNDILRL